MYFSVIELRMARDVTAANRIFVWEMSTCLLSSAPSATAPRTGDAEAAGARAASARAGGKEAR